jgi:predicted hydrocarbon binding protein
LHGLIFFFLQKFLAGTAPPGATPPPGDVTRRTTAASSTNTRYLPSGVYPDDDAVTLLQSIADTSGEPLPDVVERFGEFLAPHLLKVAGTSVDPAWKLLDLVEQTEEIIHTLVRMKNPGAKPPVLETVRVDPCELHLVYTSPRRMCRLARGLIRGMGRHLGEPVEIEETSCMLRGDPFCTFVLRTDRDDTGEHGVHEAETVMLDRSAGLERVAGEVDVRIESVEPAAPRTIGGHRIIRLLGSGGMGRVWLAHDDRLDRDVAIKVLLPARAIEPTSRERFVRESRAAAQVDHPHVVSIYHVGEERGLPYLVMPFLEGRSLAEHLRREGPLPPAEAVRIAAEIAAGLGAAHARKLVHRDIKTENVILVGPARHVRIIDFGLAHETLVPGHRLTIDGIVVGTPAYMAPERASDGIVDGRADLFGLGVILYEMLCGRMPFEGRTAVAVLAAIARGSPTPLDEISPDLPLPLADLTMRLIAHDPADRPADANAVARSLEAISRSLAG